MDQHQRGLQALLRSVECWIRHLCGPNPPFGTQGTGGCAKTNRVLVWDL